MRIVLDANVLVAAFGFGGICRAVLEVCADAHEVFLSEHILGEVSAALQDKLGHKAAAAEERVAWLREIAEIVDPEAVPEDACRDPADLPVVGSLLAAKADSLVTGDKDLLTLGHFNGRAILSPRQFWQSLK